VSNLVGYRVSPCCKSLRDVVNMAFSVTQSIICPADRIMKANKKIMDTEIYWETQFVRQEKGGKEK
jgi:hypothetical protein